MSSKLRCVRDALSRHQQINVAGVYETEFNPHRTGFFAHMVTFYVAPKLGIYDAKVLQHMLEHELVPGLSWTTKNDFRESQQEFRVGSLYFDEEIGMRTNQETILLADQDLLPRHGFNERGTRSVSSREPLYRRISITLWPNLQFGRIAFEEGGQVINKADHLDFFHDAV